MIRHTSLLAVVALLVTAVPAARAQSSPSGPAPAPFTATGGTFFALSVGDLEATARWYRETLGMREVMRPPKHERDAMVLLEGAGLMIELIARDGSRPARALAPTVTHDLDVHGLFKVGFFVEDLDRAIAGLRARGVALAFGPFPAREGVPANAAIRDPEGNYIQLFDRRP